MASRKGRSGKAGDQAVNLIIRREEIVEGGHHGGAWKVAYADFVTAMMAFFLLMWLINATTEAQRVGLADYFSQANVLNRGASGEGKPFGGSTPFDHGALSSDRGAVRVTVGHNPVSPRVPNVPQGQQIRPDTPKGAQLATQLPGDHEGPQVARHGSGAAGLTSPAVGGLAPGNLGHRRFAAASRSMKQAIAADPALRVLSRQVSIHETPQGLKIQIMDTHKRPMFKLGSALPNDMTRQLIRKITPILVKLGDQIDISGFTDATPYLKPGHSNWDLSVDRANATRRLMEHAGLPKTLISGVAGYADRRLLLPQQPRAAGNRRVAIMVLRPTPVEQGTASVTVSGLSPAARVKPALSTVAMLRLSPAARVKPALSTVAMLRPSPAVVTSRTSPAVVTSRPSPAVATSRALSAVRVKTGGASAP